MKKIITILALITTANSFAQVMGNSGYLDASNNSKSVSINNHIGNNRHDQRLVGGNNNLNNLTADINIKVRGVANLKADTYVAIFSLTQVGKTAEEVNKLIDNRITSSIEEVNKLQGVETFIDMVSFVPVYEMQVEKKIFSKKTYNEVPAGFEVKKNLHIKYSDGNLLNNIIAVLSKNEIYDLVKVDYFSENVEATKKQLMEKSKTILLEKIKNYEAILGESIGDIEKYVADNYRVVVPTEMYQTYQAYNGYNLSSTIKKVNTHRKSTSYFYQPVTDRSFDFVINPTIFEPVTQVMYEIDLKINRAEFLRIKKQEEKEKVQYERRLKEQEKNKSNESAKYFIVTPNGEVKNLTL